MIDRETDRRTEQQTTIFVAHGANIFRVFYTNHLVDTAKSVMHSLLTNIKISPLRPLE